MLTSCAIALLVLAGSVARADACSCLAGTVPEGLSDQAKSEWLRETRQRAVTAEFDRAIAVFSGEVIAVEPTSVRFKLDRAWKGQLQAEFDMTTTKRGPDGSLSRSSCDFGFRKGVKYVVFAMGTTLQTMQAFECTQTAEWSSAAQTVEALDAVVKARRP